MSGELASKTENPKSSLVLRIAALAAVVAPLSFLLPVIVMWMHLYSAFSSYGESGHAQKRSLIAEWSRGDLSNSAKLSTVALHLILVLLVVVVVVLFDAIDARHHASVDQELSLAAGRTLLRIEKTLDAIQESTKSLADAPTESASGTQPILEEMSANLLTASGSLQELTEILVRRRNGAD